MLKNYFLHPLLAATLLVSGALPGAAQTSSKSDGKVYTYVEKMPQLLDGGGMIGIITAIQQRIQYPPEALRAQAQGRVFVKFTVGPDGQVRQVTIVKGLRPDCDSAVVQAVRQLPSFEPGIQDGKPVAVSFTAPVNFAITGPRPPKLGLIR